MMSTKFYVPRMLWASNETASVAPASWTDGNGHNAFDYNPDSLSQATTAGSGSRALFMDLDPTKAGTSVVGYSLTFAGAVIRDWDVEWQAGLLQVLSGTVKWSPSTGRTGNLSILDGQTNGIVMGEFNPTSDKYWQVHTPKFPSVGLRVSMFMVGSVFSIPVRWNWEPAMSQRAYNTETELPDGRVLSRNLRSETFTTEVRTYELVDDNTLGTILQAHRAARGRHFPMIVVDDGLPFSFGRLMRFASNDPIEYTEVVSGLWNVRVPLQEVPRRPDNRAY